MKTRYEFNPEYAFGKIEEHWKNWKEKRNLKDHPTVMDYNEKTLYRATTESAEMYNSESSSKPRKLQWRVREGKMIGENS